MVEAFDNGQTFDVNACSPQFIAAVLKGLFDEESHANEFGTGLLYEVHNLSLIHI